LALVLGLAACAPRETQVERVILPPAPPLAKPPAAQTTPPAPLRNQPNPFRTDQYWSGTYSCLQGATDVTVHVTRVTGNAIEAEFQFEVESDGTSGSFRMTGAYDVAHAEISFHAGSWISRPASYETVDLHGTVSTSGDRIEGKIDHAGCGSFTVELEQDEDYD
jgi:hypothetical protein